MPGRAHVVWFVHMKGTESARAGGVLIWQKWKRHQIGLMRSIGHAAACLHWHIHVC